MPKFHPLKVIDVRRETKEAVSVAFDVPETLKEEYRFIQGQYLTLKAMINGEEIRRNYSVCVSPFEDELRVAIKKVPGGRFSTFANEQLKTGDVLDVMTPIGKFHSPVHPDNKKTYIGFAGGSGITPVISILKTVLQTEPGSQFILFYGNKGIDSIIFKEQLEALKNTHIGRLTIHHVFSEEKLESDLFNGFITVDKCKMYAKLLFDALEVDEYFICGPEPMMLAIREALQSLGVSDDKIHIELFTTPGAEFARPVAGITSTTFDRSKESRVTIIIDGNSFEFKLPYSGKSILDAALEQGADLPYACKGGVCTTCKARLDKGKVEMDVNYGLEPDELEAGYILTCQSHPRSEELEVDYDV